MHIDVDHWIEFPCGMHPTQAESKKGSSVQVSCKVHFMKNERSKIIHHIQLLTLVVESRPQARCPDWACAGAEASAAAGVVLLGLRGLEQQVGAAGWWVLQDDLAGRVPSVAVPHPVTAAQGAGKASAAGVGLLEVSGQGLLQMVSAGRQTVASELEVNLPGFAEESPDQMEVSGFEELPDLVVEAGLVVLGQPWPGHWAHRKQGSQQIVGPVQEVGLEAVGVAEMGDFAEDHLQEKNKSSNRIQYFAYTFVYTWR